MPCTDPRRRRLDDQSDYEDPIDRYRAFDDEPRPKRKKSVNPNANSSWTFGLISLVPCLGLLFGPLAILFAFLGLRHVRLHPDAGGKEQAKSGLWFAMLGCFINYGLPAIFILLTYLARVR